MKLFESNFDAFNSICGDNLEQSILNVEGVFITKKKKLSINKCKI